MIESQREESLKRVRSDEKIACLSNIPTPGDPVTVTRVAELRTLLERGQGVSRAALQMALGWLRRPVTDFRVSEPRSGGAQTGAGALSCSISVMSRVIAKTSVFEGEPTGVCSEISRKIRRSAYS